MKHKRKQEPFEPTVGLTQVRVLHGDLPNVLGDYDQQTMVDVLTWASENVVSAHGPYRFHNKWFIWAGRGNGSPCRPFTAPTLYAALLAAWKARGEK